MTSPAGQEVAAPIWDPQQYEQFGTERVAGLTSEEIAARVAELARMTRFIEKPLTLR